MAAPTTPRSLAGDPLRRDTAPDEGESGTAILEFALVLPILLVLLGGAFELGRAFLIHEVMISAVRSGVSYLARVPDPSCDDTCAPGAARAIGLTRDQIVADAGVPPSMVAVSSRDDPAARTVTVTADVRFAVDLLRLAGFRPTMTLDAAQTERRLAD